MTFFTVGFTKCTAHNINMGYIYYYIKKLGEKTKIIKCIIKCNYLFNLQNKKIDNTKTVP